MPREILLKKVPFPLPNPEIFNLDQILAATTDTVVSENGEFKFSLWLVIFSFSLSVTLFYHLSWFLCWDLQLWLSMILILRLISWKDTLLSFLSNTVRVVPNLVLQSVKKSLLILGHEVLWIFFFSFFLFQMLSLPCLRHWNRHVMPPFLLAKLK